MRAALFTLTLLACGATATAAVYKWVDANGVVHYSDQPQPGAEKVHIEPPQTYRAPGTAPAPAAAGDNAAAGSESPQPVQGSCNLESPGQDEVLMNTSSVSGRVRMGMPLNPGDRIAVLLDGMRYDFGGDTSGAFTLTQVVRGTHTLAALVETADGQQRCQTETVTFHVRQPSTQAPTSPVHPH